MLPMAAKYTEEIADGQRTAGSLKATLNDIDIVKALHSQIGEKILIFLRKKSG